MDKVIDKVIELPDPLPYPTIRPIQELQELVNKFCYVFRAYPRKGVCLTIVRAEGEVCIRLADWEGKLLSVQDNQSSFIDQIMTEYSRKITTTMRVIGVPRAIFYFSEDNGPRLVDMRLSINKFCGPGYLADFFGKQDIPTQERIGEPIHLKPEEIKKIATGEGIYTHSSYIVKPSAFKSIIRENNVYPMYGVIDREAKQPS